MKVAFLNSCVVTACFLFISNGSYADPTVNTPISLDQAINKASTPKAVVNLMRREFTFVEDYKLFGLADYWQSPEELWKRKKGDCEDFALFAQYALAHHGMEAYVISAYGMNGYAHTFVIFKEGGVYHVINEDRLYHYGAKSIEEAISRVYPYWSWGAIAKRKGTRGQLIRKILNLFPSPNPSFDPFADFPF